MVNVLGAVAQWEREATAERTSAALQVLKHQGRATGGVAPYGFQFIGGRREWHRGEQETLAAIIEHRSAGLSWAKVADKLNATGRRTRTGGRWTRQGAHQVHRARERELGAQRDGRPPQRHRPTTSAYGGVPRSTLLASMRTGANRRDHCDAEIERYSRKYKLRQP